MLDRIRFFLNRIGERLWVRPLLVAVMSICGVFLASIVDDMDLARFVPEISAGSIETLLKIMSSSMLVIATFAVASMLSAYASASNTATPRSFSLVIADDVSQNALSTFVGAFIFSIVALIALTNGYYDRAGRFALFALTLTTLALVVITFVRWVDRIARLGRLGATVSKVETAAAAALKRRRLAPNLHGVAVHSTLQGSRPVYAETVGYVQRVDVELLQKYAQSSELHIVVAALPGSFIAPGRELAHVIAQSGNLDELDCKPITQGFLIGKERLFDDDPRFGLIVLSEIASRALSPAVNDPGTAIGIVDTLVRLLSQWSEPLGEEQARQAECDRVQVPSLAAEDLFEDAFRPISRDGAGTIEVAERLQKALQALASLGDEALRRTARKHSRLALVRAEHAMQVPQDIEQIRKQANWSVE